MKIVHVREQILSHDFGSIISAFSQSHSSKQTVNRKFKINNISFRMFQVWNGRIENGMKKILIAFRPVNTIRLIDPQEKFFH